MSALDAVFAIYGDGLRALADLIDPPAPSLLHDFDAPVPDPVSCPERHYPKWLTDALDEGFEALATVVGTGLTGEQLIWYGDPKRTGNYGFQAFTDEETRRAEGTQHAQTPGEVSADPSPDPAPSPGDLSWVADSVLLAQAADAIYGYARSTPNVLAINDLLNLADALRDRGAQFAAVEAEPFVSREDLAAHITAELTPDDGPDFLRDAVIAGISDHVASSLVGDFYITKK
ncbi:hypothetical protein A5637_13370 [Mycolicibacterium fortuitum]|uniref:hypothetical protein n=1 Tax=Mycolicibacterium fortuitum TaxID=1766 RepID=UPI0007EC6935|nr:hypothetical protein [Mycolicibacterium fortuitum]OBK04065.1 hypothetical protein A5637_13370 [Mycolicibacterium fortuitum]